MCPLRGLRLKDKAPFLDRLDNPVTVAWNGFPTCGLSRRAAPCHCGIRIIEAPYGLNPPRAEAVSFGGPTLPRAQRLAREALGPARWNHQPGI
jgi:hypothetical protein